MIIYVIQYFCEQYSVWCKLLYIIIYRPVSTDMSSNVETKESDSGSTFTNQINFRLCSNLTLNISFNYIATSFKLCLPVKHSTFPQAG